MKTDGQAQKQSVVGEETGKRVRAKRTTAVRKHCRPSAAMKAEVKRSLPQIVRAQIERAQGGSLQHAKWLVELAHREDGVKEEQAEAPQQSLALLLLEQLGRGS